MYACLLLILILSPPHLPPPIKHFTDFLVHLYDHFDTRLKTPPSPDTTTKPLALSQFFGFGYMITIQVD